MFIIQEVLISDDVINEHFLCQLDACRGACCWEGDFGAPLEMNELETLDSIYEEIKPFLRVEGIKAISNKGLYTFYEGLKSYGTSLEENGACVFLTFDEKGIATCGIEKAYEAGVTQFRKPISCHLYPVRVAKNKTAGFEALNYDKWDICSAACTAGKKAKLPVYKFVKDALLRKYGADFFDELEAAVDWKNK